MAMRTERNEPTLTTQGAHQTWCAPRRSTRRATRRAGRAAHGFTLIEVMVALTIFVIGAVAIIRIFPPALNAIQSSGDRSVAARFNSSELGAFAANPKLVPDAVYDVDSTGAYTSAYEGAFVGNRLLNNGLPDGNLPQNISLSALSHFRFIRGEKHQVVYRDKTGSPGNQEFFVLTRYPYAGSVVVNLEGKLTGVQLDTNGELDFSNAKDSNGNPAFDADAPKRPSDSMRTGYTYYVDYQWREAVDGTNVRTQGVSDEPVFIPKDGSATFPLFTTNGATVLQAKRSASVSIPKQSVTVSYRSAVALIPYVAQEAGVGYAMLPSTVSIAPGTTVSLDYMAAGWNLLLEDAQPTLNTVDNASNPVKQEAIMSLSVKNLDDDAPTTLDSLYLVPALDNPNHFVYSALDHVKQGVTSPAKQPSSGTNLPGEIINLTPGITSPNNQSSLKDGRIVFNATRNVSDAGAPQSRVAYLTLDQWHHQLSVAAKNYTPFYGNTTGGVNSGEYLPSNFNLRERWREYFLTPGGTDPYLYLRPSEAGKTLLVSYEYKNSATTFAIVNDGLVTVEDQLIDKPNGVPAAMASDPSPAHPKGLVARAAVQVNNLANPILPTAILAVKGASIQSRTAWTSGTQFQQTVLSGYRPQESSQ